MGLFIYDPGARIVTPLSVDLTRRLINQLSPVAAVAPLRAEQRFARPASNSHNEHYHAGPPTDSGGQATLRALDIMTRELVTLPASANWQDARKTLQAHGIHHLVLVDDSQQVTGLLAERNLLAYPDEQTVPASLGSLTGPSNVAGGSAFTAASPDTPVTTLAYLMLEQALDAVVITDAEQVRGILTQRDLIKALLPEQRIDNWS